MVEFTNPYATEAPFKRAHFDCPNCGGKLWEYAIQKAMVCEDCRELFDPDEVMLAQLG
jgi:predicted RNA-binding Zn-ribbon protein involved in translation (DUF1610 family)